MRQIFMFGTGLVLVAHLCACSTEPSDRRGSSLPSSPGKKVDKETANAEARTPTQADAVVAPAGPTDWQQVAFAFAGPDADSDHERGEVTLVIETDFAAGTYGLFYNQTHHSLDGAKPIAEDIDPSVKEIAWDTTGLETRTYFVFAILEYRDSINVRFFPGSLNIVDDASGNRAPFVQLLNGFRENRGQIGAFQPGENINLNVVAIDPDQEAVTFEILLSQDDGMSWESLGDYTEGAQPEGNPEQGRFTIPFTMPDVQAEARLRVAATDESGNTGEATSKAFNIGTLPAEPEA